MTNSANNKHINNEKVMAKEVFLRPALTTDIPALTVLINRCYLFEEGWTSESELVGGIRTNQNEIQSVIEDDNQHFFVYSQTNSEHETVETGELLGCINIGMEDDGAYIGFFAVNPELQGSGVGSIMLEKAEILAQQYLTEQRLAEQKQRDSTVDKKPIKMLVLKGRDKMLAYYQRRGYVCTGNTQSFQNDNESKGDNSKDSELHFTEIAKTID